MNRIEITSTAQNKLRDGLRENPGKFPRIYFSEGGFMAPPVLKLSFEEIQQGDIEETADGFHLLVAEDVSYFAQKMIVDYDQDRSFEIKAQEELGCSGDCASCQDCSI